MASSRCRNCSCVAMEIQPPRMLPHLGSSQQAPRPMLSCSHVRFAKAVRNAIRFTCKQWQTPWSTL
eukprot:6192403-Pleurochrysis_carterae.AAC.6